ncbi:MAG: hypothetical protein K0S74_637 [Chlamydiales bacterium]|jgi:tetratricopeptide (TPR) repeat protein|nr:hypothetical protein [Chlamydiales bacterium]
MTKPGTYLPVLQGIQKNKDFHRLETLFQPDVLQQMAEDERSLLSSLLLDQITVVDNCNEESIAEILERAFAIMPDAFDLVYRQSLIGLEQGKKANQNNLLLLARQRIQHAVKLEPTNIHAWATYAKILLCLVSRTQQPEYFEEVQAALSEAKKLAIGNEDLLVLVKSLQATYYFYSAQVSEEPIDYIQALEIYNSIETQIGPDANFLIDYTRCIMALYNLVGSIGYLQKAAVIGKKIAYHYPQVAKYWYEIGLIYQQYYRMTEEHLYFQIADESFKKAEELGENSLELWLNWGILHFDLAQQKETIEILDSSVRKLSLAAQFSPHEPQVIAAYTQAISLMGTLCDSLEFLNQAKLKIQTAVEAYPTDSYISYAYATCLAAWGEYFSEDEFYFDAVEILKQALNVPVKNTQIHSKLWYQLGNLYYGIGDMLNDSYYIEQAIISYQRAVSLERDRAKIWTNWGVALAKMGQLTLEKCYFELAIERFQHVIYTLCAGEENADLETLYQYGSVLDLLGDFDQDEEDHYNLAVGVLERVVEQDPEHLQARHSLALALFHRGEVTAEIVDFQDAAEHFQKLAELNPEDDVLWHDWGVTLLHLAAFVDDTSHTFNFEQVVIDAESKLLEAAKLGNIYVFYHLACLYALKEQYEDAIKWLTHADHYEALPSIDELMSDDWLEDLRETDLFRNFIAHLKISNE